MPFIWNRVGLLLCFCVLGLGLLFVYSSSFGAAADVTEVEAMVICHFEVDEPQVDRVEDIIAAKSTLQEACWTWESRLGKFTIWFKMSGRSMI